MTRDSITREEVRDSEYRREGEEERVVPPARASWGAIFAGTAMALAVWFMLSMLGAAVGLSSFDPAQDADPFSGFGVGMGLWLAVQIIVALFVGGWVSGRLAGKPRGLDGALNAGVVWALAFLLGIFGVTSFTSSLVSGVTSVVSKGASVAAGAVGGVIDEVGKQTPELQRGQIVSTIQREAQEMLRQTDSQALQPGQVEETAEDLKGIAGDTARDIAASPQDAQQELSQAINQAFGSLDGVVDAADRDAVVNVLAARTNMSRAEASETVDQWAQTYQEALAGLEEAGEEIAATAKSAAGDASDAVATVLWWSLLGIVLGLFAALAGGYIGSPRLEAWREREEIEHRRHRVVYAG
ncbi:YrzE family protein [Bradymonas sediminis]|uniref:Uncharacterized protein n=1 Tax=Bradymonas sediminis TaxID=1548548 RepID=A0A2Z4FGG5_9DELT|nr:YrzE family protein [Bradymonas sediminis]AWV88037.1 hypothetical protein DN745_01290 [Bradymonas sediminis]TDP77160.1 hypothetical protein DFR33_10156 [Bradymonas sediminis]